MKESTIRQEIYNMLRRLYFWPMTQTDTARCPHGHLVHPPKGRPDILVLSPRGQSTVVECKLFPREGAFPFSAIDTGQHRWLNNWTLDGGTGFLALGTHGRAGVMENPRRLWLVPWRDWLRIEMLLRDAGQASLPLINKAGQRRAVQDGGLCAVNLLKKWELEWRDGCWHLGELHPLGTMLLGRGERDLKQESKRWRGNVDRNASDVQTLLESAGLSSSGCVSTVSLPERSG